ncbi:gfo/Idh/MocA family oxidoreductase [Bacillus sp. HMF5848]|uniref:Gfo/Idh/MocA family protein n=1 Tax=Bacillus sp. HMF5848 TaxID=2495421 RepID=UPI000F7A1E5F|nr:Gfo/Idh/MocA family oxidoreductase [Bacillus sp. HMF5848]RSK28895.1 gfo/Idh/MocA family oxidoreductase [Bacillus sp. HMF5848]
MKVVKVGLVGLGGMSRAHIRMLGEIPNAKIVAVCDIKEDVLKTTGDELAIEENKRFTDYEDLIKDADVDGVLSITPNDVHAGVIEVCIKYGKPVMAEKPFTVNFEEARKLANLYKENPIPCMVGFSYRYIPAFRQAKKLLEENAIGKVRHVAVRYLQGWGSEEFNTSFSWRFSKKQSGSGALGDLGAHMIDSVRYLIGELKQVSAMTTTFISERPDAASGEMKHVDVDDFTSFQATFDNNIMGLFVTTRNAIGSGNELDVTVYGENGTINICCERPDRIEIKRKDKTETLHVAPEFYRNQLADFIDLVLGEHPKDMPNFYDGYHNQRILDKIIESAEQSKYVNVEETMQ